MRRSLLSAASLCAPCSAAGLAPWRVRQQAELVSGSGGAQDVVALIRTGFDALGFASSTPGYIVSVLEVSAVPAEVALSSNWSCPDGCARWTLEFEGVSPDLQRGAHG